MLTTLPQKAEPGHTALVLVDVLNAFCAEGGAMHREGRDVSRYVRVTMHEIEGAESETPVLVGYAPASEHLRGPDGGLRAGALLTLLDMVGGLCGGLAALPDGSDGTLRAGSDAADARWFTPEELVRLPLTTGLLDALVEWAVIGRR